MSIAESAGSRSTSAMISRSASCRSSRDARPSPRRAANVHMAIVVIAVPPGVIAVTSGASSVDGGLDLLAIFAPAVATDTQGARHVFTPKWRHARHVSRPDHTAAQAADPQPCKVPRSEIIRTATFAALSPLATIVASSFSPSRLKMRRSSASLRVAAPYRGAKPASANWLSTRRRPLHMTSASERPSG